MIGADNGLRFWLRYVEAKGGLADQATDSALVVLPPQLQTDLELDEEVVVTGDPDVAREDGAMLLAACHPTLGKAADDVLASGDVARWAISVPTTPPPAAGDLEARAREQFPVDHGRIDATGVPVRGIRSVLRVGGLVNYAISAEDHYQERVECWLDADSRLELPERAGGKLTQQPRVAADGPAGTEQLPAAIGAAHRLIGMRAQDRQTTLSGQVAPEFAAERQRAEAYYADALHTIARRRENATSDRRELLDAQAAATREEQARRLAEIEEKFEPTHEIKPYRLHVYQLPVWRLEVDVRRGNRRYPLLLDWVIPLSRFADLRCPHCESTELLVAGKTRLGCAACLSKPPVQVVPEPARGPKPTQAQAPRHRPL